MRIGADPLGGASVDYWGAIAERHRPRPHRGQPAGRPDVAVHDPRLGRQDPDGLLVAVRDGVADRPARTSTQIATGNDADADRHGIVTPDGGLMNPNHYLAVAIDYLYSPPPGLAGRTRRSARRWSRRSHDRPGGRRTSGRRLVEVPVGFKWFVPGLLDGSVGFGGEESAGASFLRTDGTVWTTDKDGILLALLASEIQAVTGESPERALPRAHRRSYGDPAYARVDAPADREQKAVLGKLSPDAGRRPPSWPASRSPPS